MLYLGSNLKNNYNSLNNTLFLILLLIIYYSINKYIIKIINIL